MSKVEPVKRPVSRVLEMSSAIRVRAMEIYRERLGRNYSPDRWNDCEWSAAWTKASVEILGGGDVA